MAQKPDGSIRIDTKIDQKGIGAGLSQLTKTLKGFAAMIGIAFSAAAIISFVKDSINAATTLSNALLGLKSIAEGSGKSFDAAQNFINDYVSDGLIPAADAVTAYKNLLARGYSTKQIEQTLTALKDAAAFGRTASLSLGEAVSSATEGLKNENSILVDNAGVTKNVSKMWKEYADKIGVSVNNLTKAQKIQAEVNGVLRETRFQTGDAAKLVNTYSGQVSLFTYQLTTLKTTLGGVFIQVLTPILQVINQVMAALNTAATVFAHFMAAVTGQSQQVTTGATKAAAAVDNMTESTEASGSAAKEAAKNLAGFDELSILQDKSGSGGGEGGAGGAVETSDISTAALADNKNVDKVVDNMKAKLKEFFAAHQDEIDRIISSWGALKKTAGSFWDSFKKQFQQTDIFEEFFSTIANLVYAILNYINLVIGAVGDLLLALNIPATIESALSFLSTAFKAIGDVIKAITPGVRTFVQKALVPIAEWVGEKVRDAFAFLAEQLAKIGDWFLEHEEQITAFASAIGDAAAKVWKFLEPLLDVVWDTAKTLISGVVDALLAFASWVLDDQKNLREDIKEIWSQVGTWFNEKVVKPVVGFFGGLKTDIGGYFRDLWGGIKEVWGVVVGWFKDKIINPLKQAFEDLKKGVITVWDGIWTGIKGNVNKIIGGIEWMINKIIGGINWLVQQLNKISFDVPDWVPAIGGKSFGFKFSEISTVSLPRLAQGAVIPPNREFAAILGDQKSGRNIETPENLLRQIMREEGYTPELLSLLREILSAIRENKVMLVDRKVLGRVVNAAQAESFRYGGETLIPV